MNANTRIHGYGRPKSLFLHAILIAMSACGVPCLAAEPLVIRSEDLLLPVGTKRILAYSHADGKVRGEMVEIVTENIRFGDASLLKVAQFNQGNRMPDMWAFVTPSRLLVFVEGKTNTPLMSADLPLKVGLAVKGAAANALAVFRVDRQERVTVPAGTFDCLVLVQEDGQGKSLRTLWTTGQSTVQIKGDDFTAVLMAIQKPTSTVADPNTRLICNFDSGDPLGSALLPNARWRAADSPAAAKAICSVEVDPGESALETPMSMRWRYHTKGGLWIQADLHFDDSWQKRTDLTIYDSISFYIKGLKPGACAFMVHADPVRPGDAAFANIPVEYTTEWKKVTVDLGAEALAKLDLTKSTQISLGHMAKENDANVLWLDEVTCHLKAAPAAGASKPKR